MHAGAALVDAARGEVLARITGIGGRPVEWIGPQQRLAWGGGLWSCDELEELRRTRPAVPQPPRTRDMSVGWIGQAMQRSLPPLLWNFWAPAGEKTEPVWLEPMWPQLRATLAPNRFRSPVVVDGRRRRIWWLDGDTWVGWDMSELGRPEALAGPGYGPRHRLIADGTLQLTGGENGATIVDPQRSIPKARLELSPRDPSGRSGPETPVGWMWDPQRGWLETRFVRTQGQLQSIEVRTSGNRVTDRIPIQGMRSLPSIVPGPGDLWAINTYQPYQEPLGATSIGRSALRLWNCARHEWTTPSFKTIWKAGCSKSVGRKTALGLARAISRTGTARDWSACGLRPTGAVLQCHSTTSATGRSATTVPSLGPIAMVMCFSARPTGNQCAVCMAPMHRVVPLPSPFRLMAETSLCFPTPMSSWCFLSILPKSGIVRRSLGGPAIVPKPTAR